MAELLEKTAQVLWLHLWQVTALLGVVALLNATLLKRRRHLAYMMWMLVLLKCVTPPLWSSPAGLFSWAARERVAVPTTVPPRYEFERMESAERVLRRPRLRDGTEDARSVAAAVPSDAGTKVRRVGPLLSWPQLLAGIWLAGFGLFVARLGWRQFAWQRVVRRSSQPCGNREILARLKKLAKHIGVRRDVELLISAIPAGPATFGVLRSRIILPKSLVEAGPRRELDLILTHELTHVRRWDSVHALLQALAQAAWWFHPLVWWGNRQIVEQRERCCDEEVVAALRCDPAEYAECLLNVLRTTRSLRVVPGSARITPLELTRKRLEMIMNFDDRLNLRTPARCWLVFLLLAFIVLPGAGLLNASEEVEESISPERLDFVAALTDSRLGTASFVEMSPDGRHVYVTSWRDQAIALFDRDNRTGVLTLREVLQDNDLAGVTDLQISEDGQIVVVSCCHASNAVIFERHPISGRLSRLDVQSDAEEGSDGLYWAIDIALSPDGRFVYVADDRHPNRSKPGSNDGDVGRITVLRIEDDGQLKPVQTLVGPDRCLDGIRALCSHPDGRTLFATSWVAGTLVVLNRDEMNGRVSVRQVLSESDEGLAVLKGVMTAACSPDGQFVYTVSGRFTDSGAPTAPAMQGVGVFQLNSDGTLSSVETIQTGDNGRIQLRGGNQLLVSGDGSRLYVTGTTSGTLVSFVRNPLSGKLTLEQTLQNDNSELDGLRGANGIAESPDGRFLYVTGEDAGSVSVLHRSVIEESGSRQ